MCETYIPKTTKHGQVKEDVNILRERIRALEESVLSGIVSPRLIHRFSAPQLRALQSILEIDKLILKFIWKYRGLRIAKTPLKKNKLDDLFCFKAAIIKAG